MSGIDWDRVVIYSAAPRPSLAERYTGLGRDGRIVFEFPQGRACASSSSSSSFVRSFGGDGWVVPMRCDAMGRFIPGLFMGYSWAIPHSSIDGEMDSDIVRTVLYCTLSVRFVLFSTHRTGVGEITYLF